MKNKSKNQKYIIIVTGDTSSLQQEVNKNINEKNGIPLGGVSFVISPSSGSWYYSQAMMIDNIK